MKKIVSILSFYLKTQGASVAPPLSTVLGNLGLNTKKFCDEFNTMTKDLPEFMLIKVYLSVEISNRTWEVGLSGVVSTNLFQLVSTSILIPVKRSGGLFSLEGFGIFLKDLYLINFFCGNRLIISNLLNLMGTLRSMQLYIIQRIVNVN